MHQTIVILAVGESEEDACSAARFCVDDLCGGGHPFDGGQVLGKEGSEEGDEVAYPVEGEEAQKLLALAFEAQKVEFFDHMKEVRYGLAHLTDEDLWQQRDTKALMETMPGVEVHAGRENDQAYFSKNSLDPGMLKYTMHTAAMYAGTSCWVYGASPFGGYEEMANEGEAAKFEKEHTKDKERVWAVLADMHS